MTQLLKNLQEFRVHKDFKYIRLTWLTILKCSSCCAVCEFLLWDRKDLGVTSVTVIINSLLNKALCCLKGHKGRGESRWEKGEEGGVPSTTSCHHVLRVRPERLQGSTETEEGLGDPTNQRGRKFSRTVPSDARQRKWQIWWAASLICSEFTAGISWGHFTANAD